MVGGLQDVMKRKAMEIDKSKIEARATGGRMPASAMSISSSAIGSGSLGSRSNTGMDLDSGPSFNRLLPALKLVSRVQHCEGASRVCELAGICSVFH
jgi:hypothetical protein